MSRRSGISIGAAPHCGDRLFRFISALTGLPALRVVRASSGFQIYLLHTAAGIFSARTAGRQSFVRIPIKTLPATELHPVKWTVKQKTKPGQEISGDQQRLPEIFFRESTGNSTQLSSGQGLRKWPYGHP